VHTVLVSPLRRALETAYHAFKNHPTFDKIKFVIVPSMRECINISSDIPSNIEESVKEFKELIPQLDDSEFNKYPDKLHYFIEDFDEKNKESIKKRIAPKEGDPIGSNLHDLLLEEAEKVYPHKFEPRWNIYDRTGYVKKFIKKYMKENDISK
jgi:hypothetical protein